MLDSTVHVGTKEVFLRRRGPLICVLRGERGAVGEGGLSQLESVCAEARGLARKGGAKAWCLLGLLWRSWERQLVNPWWRAQVSGRHGRTLVDNLETLSFRQLHWLASRLSEPMATSPSLGTPGQKSGFVPSILGLETQGGPHSSCGLEWSKQCHTQGQRTRGADRHCPFGAGEPG